MQKIIIELIDTLWNVNSLETGIAFNVYGELIDTLWNVNLNSATAIVTPAAELIDTLWNVNKAFRRRSVGNISELIDTLWNVNIHHATSLGCSALRINRYIMECKSRVQEHIKRR